MSGVLTSAAFSVADTTDYATGAPMTAIVEDTPIGVARSLLIDNRPNWAKRIAQAVGTSHRTAENWKQGRRVPNADDLLKAARNDEAVRRRMRAWLDAADANAAVAAKIENLERRCADFRSGPHGCPRI